jgi:NAD(P)-dependent dehydrogenase (short-subunit alcohol dehydrogenase family)
MTVPSLGLEGRVALVTGAGRGIGNAIAEGLDALGAKVYATSRDPETSERLAQRFGTAPVVLDVDDVDGSQRVIEKLQSSGAGIDLLVNNAGINIPQAALDVDQASWDAVFSANLRGLFFVSQAFARTWVADDVAGAIVNIGSQAGLVAIEERASYGSSKAAVSQLTRVLALEWARHSIRVNAIAPTFVRTELTASTLSRPEWAAELIGRIPAGRLGEPDDIVGGVAFLLSDSAGLITGHTLVIDGGYTIR